jgi:hypothetical protein
MRMLGVGDEALCCWLCAGDQGGDLHHPMCAVAVCLAPIVALHCERTYWDIPIVQNPTCHVGHC